MTSLTPTILIIDDEPAHQMLIERTLRKSGKRCPIVKTNTIESARQLMHQHLAHAELVILDANLGGVSSLDLLREARLQHSLHSLPIVVLSTSVLERDISAAYDAGANAYLFKAIEPSEFSKVISGMVRFFCKS